MARALVTGAGQRLGRAMAIGLARRGYDVAVHYASSAQGAAETVAQIEAFGRKAVALQADLLEDAQTEALFARSVEALGGPITCLVNNASIFRDDRIENATREGWDLHIGSNLRAPYVLIQAMAGQGLSATRDSNGEPVAAGCVVNMLDQRIRALTPEFSTYTLAKTALWTLTQTAAQGLAPHIRVNGIAPGPTLQGAHQSAADFAQERAQTVLRRGVDPADIEAALGYLLEARAVTGQAICVDGGQHLSWRM